MPIHHSKQFFRNLACPLSELQPFGGFHFIPTNVAKPLRNKGLRCDIRICCFHFHVTFLTESEHTVVTCSHFNFMEPRHHTEPDRSHSLQKLMKIQESSIIVFVVILGCPVHPFRCLLSSSCQIQIVL